MKRALLMLGLLTATTLAGCATDAVERQDLDDWKAAYEATPGAFLLDVRTDAEYEQAHIANATLIPHTSLEGDPRLPEDKSTPIFVYCRSGNRSAIAAAALADMGYTEIHDLAGGINDWIAAGYPVEAGAGEA